MRCNLPGTFLTRDLGESSWRLSRGEPEPIDVFVLGVDRREAESLLASTVRDMDIEWRADAVWLTMIAGGRSTTVRSQGAIVHEPLPHLYAALPLAHLDDEARRFWRRVFRLIRIPGGRHLLGALARRSRGRH